MGRGEEAGEEEFSHITPGRGEGQNEADERWSLPRLSAQGTAATIQKGRRERDRLTDKQKTFLLFTEANTAE